MTIIQDLLKRDLHEAMEMGTMGPGCPGSLVKNLRSADIDRINVITQR
jgi:hypothetical protein